MISRRIIFYSTALALAWALVPGCSTKNASEAGAVGTVQAAIDNVPTDGSVACISITATGAFSTTQSFDVMPGESTVFTLDGISTGTVRFDGSAYPTACAAVTPMSTPTWVSAPVLATVTTGQLTMVTLDMNQAGGAGVDVGFNQPPPCRAEGLPCLSGGECCSGACGADNNCAPAGSVCGPGAILCNGACTDVSSDPKNCGACGLFCPPGDACVNGTCACPPGSLLCAPGFCAEILVDLNNCGGCGIVCPPPEVCIAGKCGGPCTPNGGPCGVGAQCCSGQCDAPGICGGGCVPITCAQEGFNCGIQPDGCGGQIDCGICPAGLTCGPNGVCGGGCVPITCAEKGLQCGEWPDGCGNVLDCGVCPAGETCGGSGVPGVCGGGVGCQVATDCPPSPTSCAVPVCNGGICGTVDAPAGLPCTDAGGLVCDGAGDCVQCLNASQCPGSPTPCSLPICTNGVCGMLPAPNGTLCAPPSCNGSIFTPPSICIASACVPGATIDCAGGGAVCNPGTGCMPPTCTDGIQDGTETDVDCGGPACPACPPGEKCALDSDCITNACDAVTKTCAPNQCLDHRQDGIETDVDCGGGVCPACAPGKKCLLDGDCINNACDAITLTCVANQCSDHRQDGTETDVDCGGGVCPSCAIGQHCATNLDCAPGHICNTFGLCQ
jgi:hypothetical protein